MIPRRFFWLFDLIVISGAFVAAYLVVPLLVPLLESGRPFWGAWLQPVDPIVGSRQLPPFSELLWILLAMAIPAILLLQLLGNDDPLISRSRTRVVGVSLLAPLGGLSFIALVLFALKSPGWSRLLAFLFAFLCGLALASYRLILRRYFFARRAAGYYHKNVLFVGQPAGLEWLARYFAENVLSIDYQPFGYLRVHPDQPQHSDSNSIKNGLVIPNLLALGDVDELGDLLIHRPIHEVISIHPVSGGEWIEQVIQDCDYLGMPLRIIPEALLLRKRKGLKTLYPLQPLNLPAVVLRPPHWDSEALFFKRLLDIFFSAALLGLLLPLFILITIAIKVTKPGSPIFYRWRVVGRNGVEFTGYKFTTMIADADQVKGELAAQNEMTGPVFKMKDDPRVTPLGKFLRKYSLNELPQLWSVLKGDMSLVGPRPAFRHELQRYEFWHKRKLSIQPGITCLWQVSGRNRINNFDDWVAMDLEYIDNWSLWLDFKILFRTAKAVIAGTGW